MVHKSFLYIVILFSFAGLYANTLLINDFMNEKEIADVLSGSIITRMYLKNNALGENSDEFIKVPTTSYSKESFSEYEMITDEKAFFPYNLSEKDILEFYTIISSPSKLKGTKYYSRRDEKIDDLILDCYQIDDKNKRINDTVQTEIKEYIVGRFRQKDNKFGTLNFKSELYNQGNNFVMIATCENAIPLISGKDEYKIISYFIYDEVNKGFFYYSVFAMRIRTEMFLTKNGLKTLAPTTFSNRLRAATVQIAHLIGLDWSAKYNPWENDLMGRDKYR